MSESSLSITYSDLQREVAVFLGWPRTVGDWNSDNSADFTYLLKRGLRMFYFPPGEGDKPRYEWTFMRSTGTVTLATGTSAYDLADDFGGVILDRTCTFAEDSGNRALLKISEDAIRKNQAMASDTGVPKYYAVRPKAHSATTGQRWEMLVYPTPSSSSNASVLTFRYVAIPDVLTSVNKYPVGGGQYSEVILAAVLAAAEMTFDVDTDGVQAKLFRAMLSSAMRTDLEQKENKRGGAA